MKYMGSKARTAKELLSIILASRNGRPYWEPFAGGMNMICEVPANGGERIASDNSVELIAFWKAFVAGWRPPVIDRGMYADLRAGAGTPELRGWAGFNCSYSGKWFGGFAGVTKTRNGVRDYIKEALANCEAQAPKLQGVKFIHGSYDLIPIAADSVIYCDPPYANTTGYHTAFDTARFWEWVRIHSQKHSIFVSEYTAPSDFACVWEKSVRSSLSANGACGRSIQSFERLFVYRGGK